MYHNNILNFPFLTTLNLPKVETSDSCSDQPPSYEGLGEVKLQGF
jgi:hypothetical protein